MILAQLRVRRKKADRAELQKQSWDACPPQPAALTVFAAINSSSDAGAATRQVR